MDGIVDKYLELLSTATDKGKTLTLMYCEMFEVKMNVKHITMFRKFTKMYGYQRVLSCLMDMYDIELTDKENVYGLLSYLLKKKINEKVARQPDDLLVDYVKEIEKKKKGKL